jgi:predicted nucleic acid-binding protein
MSGGDAATSTRSSWDPTSGASFSDAGIVAAAKVGGWGYVLTEDLQDGQEIAGVRVVDPFRTLPNALN